MSNLPFGRGWLVGLGAAVLAGLAVAAPVTAADNPGPSISIGKLEKIATYSGGYLPGPITGSLGQTVAYEIVVTNTGPVQATVSLTDSSCTGLFAEGAQTLAPGEWVSYTCTHDLSAVDGSSYENTATATATSADGQTYTTEPVTVFTTIVPVAGAHHVIVKHHHKKKKAKKPAA